jgi:hypothetical protein
MLKPCSLITSKPFITHCDSIPRSVIFPQSNLRSLATPKQTTNNQQIICPHFRSQINNFGATIRTRTTTSTRTNLCLRLRRAVSNEASHFLTLPPHALVPPRPTASMAQSRPGIGALPESSAGFAALFPVPTVHEQPRPHCSRLPWRQPRLLRA